MFVQVFALLELCSKSSQWLWCTICLRCIWKLFQRDEYVVFIDYRFPRTKSYPGMNCYNYFNCVSSGSKWVSNICYDYTIPHNENEQYLSAEQIHTTISEVIWRQSSKRDFLFFVLGMLILVNVMITNSVYVVKTTQTVCVFFLM